MTAVRAQNVVILDGRAAAILWQQAHLNDLRIESRGRDEELYDVLVKVYQTALTWRTSIDGKIEGKVAELEESGKWATTPEQVAKRLGVTSRTVRNDISRGRLPAEKQNRVWIIPTTEAETYIAARS